MDTPVVGVIALTAIMGLTAWAVIYLANKQANNPDN